MPSVVADPLFHRLIDAFPPTRAYTPAAFEREPMPSPVAHFLKHWLAHRVRREASYLAWPQSEWFDDEHEAVQQARQTFVDVLTEHGHFPAAAWETSLREAVQQVTTYLIRPVVTLDAFVFQENAETVPADVMDWRLGYFKNYNYFHEALRLFVEQRAVETINRHHFTELLRKIDQKITKNYDTALWLRLLGPLFDLARRAGTVRGAPISSLLTFFKEKGAEDIVRQLQTFQQRQGVDALDEGELRRLLEAVHAPAFSPATPQHSAPPAVAPTAATPTGPVPRWKQFQQSQPPPAGTPPRRHFPYTPDEVKAPVQKQEAVPRWMQFRNGSNHEPENVTPPSQPVSLDIVALEHAVLGEAGARYRDLFVNHLFTHSLDAYQRVLKNLYTVSSWVEASKIIAEEVFRKNQVDIYSDPAVLFTDTVEARYAQREA